MNLSDLQKALEEATGPDRKIDFWLMAFDPTSDPSKPAIVYTASLDAAIALANRLLPGWGWRCGFGLSPHWVNGRAVYGWSHLNRVHPDHALTKDEATGYAASAPLAICLAIVRALLAKETAK